MSVLLAPGSALAAPGAPPSLNPDTITTSEDAATTGNVLANDTNPGEGTLQVTAFGPLSPTVGTLTVAANGDYTFTPAANWFGTASTTYDAANDKHTRTAAINIVVTGTPDAPIATDDSFAVTEDTATNVTSTILANDSDPDGGTLSVTSVSNATGGGVVQSGGTVTFTPVANLCGPGLGGFDYTISDGSLTASAHASIDITCVDDAPVANDDSASGTEDTDVVVDAGDLTANDTDVENDPLTVTGVSGATGGTVALDGTTVTFSPDPNECGLVEGGFDYTVSDGNGGTDTGHVTVDLDCVNDAPVANDDSVTLTEDDGATDITATIVANDTDADGDTTTIDSVDNATGGTADLVAGVVTYAPSANVCGNAAGGFDYTISDGNGGTDTGHVTVDITCVDDAPVANDDSASGTEDTDVVVDAGDLTANDTDVENDPLTVTGVSGATGGTVALDGTTITFSPDPNECGLVEGGFDYTVSDGNGGTDTGHVTVDLDCVNDAPVANDDSASGTEDTDVVLTGGDLTGNDTDADGDVLTVDSVGNASNGTVALEAGTITFSSDADQCGPGEGGFDYTVSDGNGGTDTGHVTIDLDCVNDAPVAVDDTLAVGEDTSATDVTADLLANDTDADGDLPTVTGVANATGGSADFDAGSVTFTPDPNLCGAAAGGFDYDIADGNGGTDTGHATVDITCVNDAPVATDDNANGTEDTDAVIDGGSLTSNDTDVENDSLSVSGVSDATGGTVELEGATITFTPDADLCGDGEGGFDYTVSDGNGGTDTGHVTIDLECVNDAPVAVDDTASGTEDTDVVIDAADLATNDTDVENDTVSVTGVSGASHGSVDLDAGTITFTPAADRCGDGSAGFDYTVSDGSLTDIGHVTIDLDCVNDDPVAVDDGLDLTENDGATDVTALILANDSDVDNDTLTVTGVDSAVGGDVDLTDDTVTFTPTAGLCGPDTASFEYDISDGNGGTAHASVSIDITCANEAPVAHDDNPPTGTEDTNVVIDGGDLTSNDTDADSDPLTVTSIENLDGGTATFLGDTVTFTPDADLCGDNAAGFDYVVSDGQDSDTGHVTIDLECVNDAPVAVDDFAGPIGINSGADDYSVLGNDTDAEHDPLSIKSVSVDPSAGTAVKSGDEITFTPAAAFSGEAVIGYVVTDGSLDDDGTLTITVGPDVTAPVVAPPTVAFASGRVDQSVPLRVTWSAVDAGVGVASYEVQVSVAGGAYHAVYSGPNTSNTRFYPLKTSLKWRVRATDREGNTSGWVTSAVRRVLAYQNSSKHIVYVGPWQQVRSAPSSGAGYAMTATKGARVKLQFTGRSVIYVSPKNAVSGHVKVYVDGVLVGRFNLHSAATSLGRMIAKRTWASNGQHTIRVVDDQAGRHTNFDVFLVLR